jgi:acetylornithine deacetylase
MVRTIREALSGRGLLAEVRGEGPWMDSALLAAAGADTAVVGPAGAGAHADEEWVELESVFRLAEVLADAAAAWCGDAGGG